MKLHYRPFGNKLIFFFFLSIIFSSCDFFAKTKTGNELARANNEYLYYSDILEIVPTESSAKDSIAIVKNYIDSWLRKKTIVEKARKNLSKSHIDFSRQMEDYHQSLIIYAYEKELIKQKLDTSISQEEIQTYYDNHKGNFELKENIVMFDYIKIPSRTKQLWKPRVWMRSNKEKDINSLIDFCKTTYSQYSIGDSSWIFLADLLKQIPIKTYNNEHFLRNTKYFETKDTAFVYMMHIKGFRIKESLSPLSFEEERIKNIIINKRKLHLINDMNNEIYNSAFQKGDIEVYYE